MGYLDSLPRPTKTYHTTTYDRIAKQHNFDGAGKTVLITGGASGIGYSFSKAFAQAGVARIAIISRSTGPQQKVKEELEALFPSTQILPYQASVTDSARLAEILQELVTVDVLVLNAAVAHRRALATEITVEEMEDAFNTNVIGAFNLTQAYLAAPTPATRCKTIINVSAAAAHLPGPFRVGYGPSKAATAQIMQAFASQFRGGEVRIFSFHPGSLYTPGTAQHFSKDALEWDDVNLPADFAVWLAGSESGFLHGRHLWANWDVDELIAIKEKFVKNSSFLTIGLVQ